MLILIKNKAVISGLDIHEIAKVKDHLTIDNPIFNQRIEMGLANWNVPNRLKYFEWDRETPGQIVVPVGALPDILAKGLVNPKPEDVLDLRTTQDCSEFFSKLKFTGELRDYQQSIIDTCKTKTIGVIEAMTGAGKTVVFVDLVFEIRQPTLILVNTIELANQTVEAFLQFTNAQPDDIGFIGSGKFRPAPIAVALHQTMAKLDPEKWKLINDNYGMIIADEVHIVAAKTYYETMSNLTAKYKFGFSATPKRDDGLTDVIHFATGPNIHAVPIDAIKDHLIKPSLKIINTDYYFPLLSTQDYQSMISDMAIDTQRNEMIVKELQTNYKDNYVILLCNRLEQVHKLHELLGDDSVILTSEMKKKDRAKAIEELKSKAKKYVISTYGLFSTGINIPHLDVAFLCSPIKSEIKLRQSAGRLMRKSGNKDSAIIVDFVDKKVELLKFQAYKRKKILSNIW